jgi:hypothetical protein
VARVSAYTCSQKHTAGYVSIKEISVVGYIVVCASTIREESLLQ